MNTRLSNIDFFHRHAVYLHRDFCGQGDVLVVHPRGFPPAPLHPQTCGWEGASPEVAQVARARCDEVWRSSFPCPVNQANRAIAHLDPSTLAIIRWITCI